MHSIDTPTPPAAELEFDCRQCGVCCTGRPGTVLVDERDLLRWKRAGRIDLEERLEPGHFGLRALPTDQPGHCLYQGTHDHPNDCSIYAERPQACRDLAPGSTECLAARSLGRRV